MKGTSLRKMTLQDCISYFLQKEMATVSLWVLLWESMHALPSMAKSLFYKGLIFIRF